MMISMITDMRRDQSQIKQVTTAMQTCEMPHYRLKFLHWEGSALCAGCIVFGGKAVYNPIPLYVHKETVGIHTFYHVLTSLDT